MSEPMTPEAITPLHCTDEGCHWAVHGIPDRYVGARWFTLAWHRAEEHGELLAPEQVAYAETNGNPLPEAGKDTVPSGESTRAEQPLTAEQEQDIRDRAAHLYEYSTSHDGEGGEWDTLAGEDVPALLAEVDRLRAALDEAHESLIGANLSCWEEEQDTARLRLALASAQRGRRELRARVAELEALELGAVDGRVSATCEDPEHPTWLRRPDDVRACPWCRVAELEAERAKYVGKEPTIAEEMAHLSGCIDSVLAVCDETEQQATRWENPLPVPEWIEKVRAAANGLTERRSYPPAFPWAVLMDNEDKADFIAELEHAAATPGATPTEALAAVEQACATYRLIAEAQQAHNTAPGPDATEADATAPEPTSPAPDLRYRVRTETPSRYLRSSTGVLHLRQTGPEDDGLSYHNTRCGWYAELGREAVPLVVGEDARVCKRCHEIEPW